MLVSWIIAVLVFGLDLVALLKIQQSSLYSRSQKTLQFLLVLLLPILGAAIVILMNPLRPDADRGDFPPAPEANQDAISGAISNFHP
jgi:H+/Cl- antiporter ClcA